MKPSLLSLGASLLVFLSSTLALADDFPPPYNSPSEAQLSPVSPEEAVRGMQLPDGFRATVFAAEPQVQNPIAMAWDDRGRMWVAENYTYADRAQRFDLSLRDRVIILEDIDNDGRADKRTVFTDQVQMLTSVEVGRGGVWLMCPPRLLFVPDADGDDIPDGPAEVVLDGFDVAESNYHNFANGLRWGPDGWLYGRCGHSCPGNIGLPGTPDSERIPLDGGIWRFHPERKVAEVLCHGTTNPWGHDWDENGELFFINTVIGHLWHMMPGAHFQESFGESLNPGVYDRMGMIADHYHFDTTGSWTASRGGKANAYGGGHAHVGMAIYHGTTWPQQYRGKLFTINMHGMRVNVERLERSGAGYVGRHEPDFFIASDPFFRGVELSVGPDGNLFVIDWSDTGECHESTGVHRTSGRIYKVSHGESRPPRPLAKPLCLAGDGPLPQLWKQYQAGKTTPAMLRELLHDPNEHVRVWAIRLLTDFWPLDTVTGPRQGVTHPDDPATRTALVDLAKSEKSGLVLLTLASTLQRLPVEHRARLAAPLLDHVQYAEDRDLPWLVWYGLIPLGKEDPEALVDLAIRCRWPLTAKWMTRNLATHVEASPQALERLLAKAPSLPEPIQRSILDGLTEAYRGWRKVPRPASWERFSQSAVAKAAPEQVRELSSLFGDGRALDEIRQIALDKKADVRTRQQALETLIATRPDDLREICTSLIDVRILNGTAVKGLALFSDPEIGRQLASKYRRFHPDDRPTVLETLVSRPAFAAALLDAIEQKRGGLAPSDLTAFHARQIRSLGDEALTRRLKEVWGELRDSSKERRALIDQWKTRLTTETVHSPDLSAGRALFNKSCAQCHRLYGEGQKIGPDLTGSQRANLDYLLENVLDPSAVVGKDYRMSIVLMKDGRVLNGLVVSQDDRILVLQTATEQKRLPREEIEAIRQTSLSPMPDGLLQNLSPKQVRDLMAYLMAPTQVPLPTEKTR